MALSRSSLVTVLAAIGLILLIGCAKKEETTETDTATTTMTETGTTATGTTGTTTTSMTGTTLTSTAPTTDTTATAAAKYGTLTTKRDKWGQVDDVNVTIKFDANNNVTATPEPAEVNAERTKPGKPTTITWTADPGVKLHVDVVKPANAPSCITGQVQCKDNKCSAQANPAIHKLPKTTVAVNCKVKIWKDGMPEPADPEVIVDNCCP